MLQISLVHFIGIAVSRGRECDLGRSYMIQKSQSSCIKQHTKKSRGKRRNTIGRYLLYDKSISFFSFKRCKGGGLALKMTTTRMNWDIGKKFSQNL